MLDIKNELSGLIDDGVTTGVGQFLVVFVWNGSPPVPESVCSLSRLLKPQTSPTPQYNVIVDYVYITVTGSHT